MYNPQLDTFRTVAEKGSFLKAAEALYVSPPAVIQQINSLESKCGVRLFERSHRGVTLTPAGRVFYEDAGRIIALCNEALEKTRAIAGAQKSRVRVGTSPLFRPRLLPGIIAKVREHDPDLSFELPSIPGDLTRNNDFSQLGRQFDVLEGIYCDTGWAGLCSFLELARTPLCCAVSPRHTFAGREKLTLGDLAGQTVVCSSNGFLSQIDAFREELTRSVPSAKLEDAAFFGMDVFAAVELGGSVLVTQAVNRDIHTNLVTVPLETGYTLPYGLIYATEPGPGVKQFVKAIEETWEELNLPAILE